MRPNRIRHLRIRSSSQVVHLMQVRSAIYLDANAGYPLSEAARQILLEQFEKNWVANPSSIHFHGRRAKRGVAEAREAIARSFGQGVDAEELIFTSSGTEANQLAIRSCLEKKFETIRDPHWITSPMEHDCILQMIPWFEKQGGRVSLLKVKPSGELDLSDLPTLLSDDTTLVSLGWVNSETGVVMNVQEIARQCAERKIPLHLDGAQVWGKLPFDLVTSGAQLVAFSGHKIGALSGSGVLWVKKGTRVEPHLLGKQEKGRRGGSENTLGCMTMGAAARMLDPLQWAERVKPVRDALQEEILKEIPGAHINGAGSERVANTLNVHFDGVEGESLVMALDMAGFSVSSGSACSSGALEPSHVLMSMGCTRSQAMAAIRVSLTESMTWDELKPFVSVLREIVRKVRSARKF